MRSATTAKNNVLILDGSPHKNGRVGQLIEALPFTEADRVRLYDTPVAPCVDCRACRITGRCAFRDMDALYRQIEEADVLIFATPVYNDSFPAPLKAAIDRCQVYWSRRFHLQLQPPIRRHKRVYLLSAAGADDAQATALIAQLKPLLTVLNGELCGTVHVGNTDRDPDMAAAAKAVSTLLER